MEPARKDELVKKYGLDLSPRKIRIHVKDISSDMPKKEMMQKLKLTVDRPYIDRDKQVEIRIWKMGKRVHPYVAHKNIDEDVVVALRQSGEDGKTLTPYLIDIGNLREAGKLLSQHPKAKAAQNCIEKYPSDKAKLRECMEML